MSMTWYRPEFGQHFPFGSFAVNYIYSDVGTFKPINKELLYYYNYYDKYDFPPQHPYNQSGLVSMANGQQITTCLDANGHLLGDFDHDGQIDINNESSVHAFCEHNGMGEQGVMKGQPFSNFWFDDNDLARLMSTAYEKELPYGLSEYTNFTRWSILYGFNEYWVPYNEQFMDTLALDGIYYLTIGDTYSTWSNVDALLDLSDAQFDTHLQRYIYSGITENYHEALMKILVDSLYQYERISSHSSSSASSSNVQKLLQHSMSLRIAILQHQQIDSRTGERLGWLSSIVEPSNSLQNSESISLGKKLFSY